MTETKWLNATDLDSFRASSAGHSTRKARFYVVACLRAGCDFGWAGSDLLRAGLDATERYADELMTDLELLQQYSTLQSVILSQDRSPWDALLVLLDPRPNSDIILENSSWHFREYWSSHPFPVVLFREIFGNPFRPVTFNPTWRTSDVMMLANGTYAANAFDRMPILADALQDAGCDSDDILNHFRDPHATHVRGCWALDLVLGRE